ILADAARGDAGDMRKLLQLRRQVADLALIGRVADDGVPGLKDHKKRCGRVMEGVDQGVAELAGFAAAKGKAAALEDTTELGSKRQTKEQDDAPQHDDDPAESMNLAAIGQS